jgi:hypothetical protein
VLKTQFEVVAMQFIVDAVHCEGDAMRFILVATHCEGDAIRFILVTTHCEGDVLRVNLDHRLFFYVFQPKLPFFHPFRLLPVLANSPASTHPSYDKIEDAGISLVPRLKGNFMKSSITNILIALGLIAIGLGLAAAGIYIGETDDAPGAALLGILLLIGAVTLSVRTVSRTV